MEKQMVKKNKDSVSVEVSVLLIKDGEYYVSCCPALNISSYGTTVTEAKKAFEEALEIFIQETQRKGTLEKVLLKLGWSLQQKPQASYRPPSISLKDSQHLFMTKNPEKIYEERIALPFA